MMPTTKDGKEITFKRTRDSEDENRGWQVDLIEAFIDDEKVGYIKLSYIPTERFNKYYPDILHYLDRITGTVVFPKEYHHNETPRRDPTILYDDFDTILLNLSSICDPWRRRLNRSEVEGMTEEEKQDRYNCYVQKINEEYGAKREEFKQFHVDKPLVDYINVEEGHRRKGIGFALYCEAARWMGEIGFRVYASGIQTKYAQAAWTKNVRELKTETEEVTWFGETKIRTYLEA